MILVVGGSGAGKRAYAEGLFGAEAVVDARALGVEALSLHKAESARVLCNAQELVRDEASDLDGIVSALSRFALVTSEDVGCGVVPVDAGERAWRERAGRLSCKLAAQADAVVRMVAGIPCEVVRRSRTDASLRVFLLRHGETAGNRAHRYVGAGTDEPLDAEGIAALERDAHAVREAVGALPTRVFTSGMLRTDDTARILFPEAAIERVDDLREMDFGAFEGRSANDMADDGAYRTWVDGWCEGACPNGESRAAFTARCVRAFLRAVRDASAHGERTAVFVVHGGTIKAILSTLSDEPIDYFAIDTPHAGWWSARFNRGLLFDCERGGAAR